ncbi:unnamed protein product [Larinioides sclopetarius]|uniref:Uncharacterized protein n=1 Tax=Larinioides sclopetarius TaxID=280406 RepID=A0AAV1Z8I3_9ARAC
MATESLYPKTTLSEIKEKSSEILKEKNKNISDTRTEIKNVYPNLKSIEHCVKIEDIESMRAIAETYTEEYTFKIYNEAVKRCREFAAVVSGIENYQLFELAKEYQNARKMSNEARARLKYLNSKLNVEKHNLWKLVKNEASSRVFISFSSSNSVLKVVLNFFRTGYDECFHSIDAFRVLNGGPTIHPLSQSETENHCYLHGNARDVPS